MTAANLHRSPRMLQVSANQCRSTERRRNGRCLGLACVIALCSGCITSTRDESSYIHPHDSGYFRAIAPDLTGYRSPEERPGRHDCDLSLAVAISGGGHRATNFGVGALIGLEEIVGPQTNALMEADYFSTVSGGGLAAGAFITSLHDYRRFGETAGQYNFAARVASSPDNKDCRSRNRPLGDKLTDPCLRRHLERGYHKELGGGFFDLRAMGSLDRGDFLEEAFDDDILGYRWRDEIIRRQKEPDCFGTDPSFQLGHMFIRTDDATRPQLVPHWICNATVYENGAIFPMSPDILQRYDVNEYTHRLHPIKRKDKDTNGQRRFALDAPVSVAMTASGTFPIAIPATTLGSGMDPKNPYIHLLDGGNADNLAVLTAWRLLQQAPTTSAPTHRVMIVIDAYKGTFAPFSKVRGSPAIEKTAVRIASIGLDSWRGRHEDITRALMRDANSDGEARVVFVSFDDLFEATFADLYAIGDFCEWDKNELQRKFHLADDAGPFEYARAIPTLFNISKPGQRFLIAAGRLVVRLKQPDIRRALWTTDNDSRSEASYEHTATASSSPH